MKTKEFIFNENNNISILPYHDEILFVAKDVAEVLEYSDTHWALKLLDDDEKLTLQIARSGQNRKTWMLTESGLYHLIIKSTKTEAKAFRKWVTKEILPSIRKAGNYSTDALSLKSSELEDVKKLIDNKKNDITNKETELKELKGDLTSLEKKFWDVFHTDPNQKKLF